MEAVVKYSDRYNPELKKSCISIIQNTVIAFNTEIINAFNESEYHNIPSSYEKQK